MDQNTKKTGLLNWVVLLCAALGMLLVSRYVSSATAVMGAILTCFGLLVALLSFFHIGLLDREQFERFFIPAFTACLFLLQAAGAYWPWQWLAALPPIIADRAKLAMSLLG